MNKVRMCVEGKIVASKSIIEILAFFALLCTLRLSLTAEIAKIFAKHTKEKENSMADDYKGYRGKALSVLKISTRLFGAMLKSKLQKEITRASFFPLETADSLHIVIKCLSATTSVAADSVTDIQIRGRKEAHYKIPEKIFREPNKPK